MDLTWVSPAASRRVSGWGVSPEETLSDHLYILMEVAVRAAMGDPSLDASGPTGPPIRRRGFPRWAATHCDEDFMVAAAITVAWSEESPTDENAEAGATPLRRDLHAICDSCMPRSGAPRRAGAGYWWTEGIASLCEACIRAQRRYTRSHRRRREDEATVARLHEAYREAWRPLQRVIKEAKRRAWGELLASLDAVPWGRPYKMVLNKLRPWAPPTTESMDPRFLGEILGTLFPGATDEENNRSTNEQEQEPQPREVGARNRESPRKNWRRLSGGSEHGRLRAPTEPQPACGRTSPGSWPRD